MLPGVPPTEVPSEPGTSVGERSGAAPAAPARRRRDVRRAGLAALAAGLAGAGYAWDARPVGPTRLLGVDYRAVVRGGQCRATWRGRSCTSIPAALVAALARARGRPTPALRAAWHAAAADQASFDVNVWTRAVRWANHLRTLDDSLRWRAALDSTRRALDGWVRAGRLSALPCDTGALHFATAEAWRAGDREVRLYAGWVRRPRVRPRPPYGYIVLHWVSYGAPGCGRDAPERHYQLLRPDEIARRAVDWLSGGEP
ncbi:hypothetical protein tb265_46390 [Gemmatimonadetes bacterium T265]|nr:hypothetical protein tb265_46390 [Gemmatimonadetes bacterium T265]